jgi:uncharacterized Zn finger protein
MHAGLSRSTLRRAADAGSFERGEEYAAEGRVRAVREQGRVLHGIVAGSEDYRVTLGVLGEELACSCTCPVGRDGSFCKHVVALGLVRLDASRPRAPSGEELREYLLGRRREELVDLLLERAAEDEWLHGRLTIAAAGTRGGPPDLAALAAAIDAAVETRGFVPYRKAYDYFRAVDAAIEAIEDLLAEHPEAVVELTEHALEALEGAYEAIDDSGGGLRLAVDRLSGLHLAACAACAPPPETLAERLFRSELTSELEPFRGAAATYADVLGPAGLARYRRLAEAEWARVPALGPGARDGEDDRRVRVRAMMEALARAAGDVDELVGVISRDLSLPYGFLRIAETLSAAGRAEEALAWAERGLAAFPERHDDRLSDFVAEAYLRAGRRDEAMAVAWDDFVARPALDRFVRLRSWAGGAADWPEWRERALDRLRGRPSELVRVLLAEDELEAAWAAAGGAGCSEELWLRLAARREADHPEDALAVYRRAVQAAVARTDRQGYEEAVALLRRMRPLAQRLGAEDAFGREVAALREGHRRKRTLVALLDGLGWPEVPPPGG